MLFLLAASRHFVNMFLLLCSPVGEYKECHIKVYQSQCRISYIHLCKNTKNNYFCFLKCYNIIETNVLYIVLVLQSVNGLGMVI